MDDVALLALQIDWGADEALMDAPINRLAPPANAVPRPEPAPAKPAAPSLPTPAPLAGATGLEALRTAIAAFPGCALRETATHSVLPHGDPAGGLVVIGDPPGAEDDRSGVPFSGPAGLVLDRLLSAIGRRRDDIMLAPLIPWRPPGNRPPTDAELAQCLPFLHRLIALCLPCRVVVAGILPTRALFGPGASLRRIRGKWRDIAVPGLDIPVPALPIFSPGTLKTAADRQALWADWRLLHCTIQPRS